MTAVWNKEGLEEFRKGLSFPRREDDARKIAKLFEVAAQSPLMKEALDWAKAHDIDFIIDRDMPTSGTYHIGTGILGLSDEMLKPENHDAAIVTLVQEIRHAWQDYNGLIPPQGLNEPFITSYMREAVLAADTEAFGSLAFRQADLSYRIARLEQRRAHGNDVSAASIAALKKEFQQTVENPAPSLWEGFDAWYATDKPAAHGVIGLLDAAKKLNLDVLVRKIMRAPIMEKALVKPEFNPVLTAKPHAEAKGVAIDSKDGLALLGRGFSDTGNYFDFAPQGALEKQALSRKAAEALYIAGEGKNWLYELYEVEEAQQRLSKHQAEASARDQAIRDARAEKEREERAKKQEALRAERKRNRAIRDSFSGPSF